ncbi:hypothetical protein LZ318_22065 [Saccharopolyspora indica]
MILPNADGPEPAWQHLAGGASQIGTVPDAVAGHTGIRVAGRLGDFDHREHLPDLPDNFVKRYGREILVVLSAVENARRDSGLERAALAPERTGVIASSARGPVEWWSQVRSGTALDDRWPVLSRGSGIFASLPGSPAALSAIRLNAQGFVTTYSNACIGGHQAIGTAAEQIQHGRADVVFVIGHEMPVVPEIFQIYSAPGSAVLSREVDPARAMKPYSADRDGFALGEGAVVLVLEHAAHAAARNARCYAGIRAVHTVNEAGHATRMDLSGARTARMVDEVAAAAELSVRDLDYICGHGTATRYNDLAEVRAVRLLYGDGDAPPLGSVKPIFGHLLGAAGVLNCAALAMMLQRQRIVPTANCSNVDPECGGDHVAEGVRAAALRSVLSLAFAIGSQSSAVVMEAVA